MTTEEKLRVAEETLEKIAREIADLLKKLRST